MTVQFKSLLIALFVIVFGGHAKLMTAQSESTNYRLTTESTPFAKSIRSPDWLLCVIGSLVALLVVGSVTMSCTPENHSSTPREGHQSNPAGRDRLAGGGTVQANELKQTLTGHAAPVQSVAFSPDSKMLVSGSNDNTVRLWDAESGALRRTLLGHEDWVTSVAISRDGTMIASGSNDNTVRLWETQTGTSRQTLTGHKHYVTSVVFSPNSTVLASGSVDSTVRIWDPKMGKLKLVLKVNNSSVTSLAFSPDSGTLACGVSDGTVKLWDAQTGAMQRTLKATEGNGVSSVAFSPDGATLAGGAMIWNPQTGEMKRILKGELDFWEWTTVAFSPDGEMLAGGGGEGLERPGLVQVWDAQSGKLLQTLTGHSKMVSSVSFSPDGKTFASASLDNTIKLWDASR